MEKRGLKLSVTENGKEGKSKMIASCGFSEDEVRQRSKEEGVRMADRVETLGVDLRTRVKRVGSKRKSEQSSKEAFVRLSTARCQAAENQKLKGQAAPKSASQLKARARSGRVAGLVNGLRGWPGLPSSPVEATCRRLLPGSLPERGRLGRDASSRSGGRTPNAVAEGVTRDGLGHCGTRRPVNVGSSPRSRVQNQNVVLEKGTKIGFGTAGARRLPSVQFLK